MNQEERRVFLIQDLIKEQSTCRNRKLPLIPDFKTSLKGNDRQDISKNPVLQKIPKDADDQKILLRSLINVRPPASVSRRFLDIQDAYLQAELAKKKIVRLSDLCPLEDDIYLWKGDITTLQCGAIVNAANSGMTGCYQPCHNCIDNCIHTYAGIQLRLKCAEIMQQQGHEEPVGQAKITPAYNLPCDYVIHTVGPYVEGKLTENHCKLLECCYQSCLNLADKNHISSIAFCCISTGVFRFPNEKASEIAVNTVRQYKKETGSKIEVIFNVYKEQDERIYRRLLAD